MLPFFAGLLLFLLPIQWAVALPVVGTVPLLRLLVPLLVVIWVVTLLTRGTDKVAPPTPLVAGVVSFLSIATLGLLLHSAPEMGGWRKLLFLGSFFPLTWVWYTLCLDTKLRLRLLTSLLTGSGLAACIGFGFFLAQFIWGAGPVFHWLTDMILPYFLGSERALLVAQYPSLLVNIAGVTWLRLTSFFPDPHVASFFFGITGLLALSLFFETKRRWFLVTAGILLLADILTFSRGGYLGLIAALAVLLWFERQSVRYFVQWGLGLTLLLLSSLVLGPVWERLISSFSLGDASSTERLVLWQTAWETWMMHPFFGVGLGQYVEWLYPGQGGTLPYYAHNLFLDIGVELGILSLMTFLILLFGAWASVWPLVKQKQPLALGIAAGLMLYGVHSLFETALFSVHILLLLTLLIGLAFALGAQPRSRVA